MENSMKYALCHFIIQGVSYAKHIFNSILREQNGIGDNSKA